MLNETPPPMLTPMASWLVLDAIGVRRGGLVNHASGSARIVAGCCGYWWISA